MAVRTFKGMTAGSTVTEATSLPTDTRSLNIRGIAVLSTAGTATITIEFKDGTIITTPRIPENTPYETFYEKEIAYIKTMSGSTIYDIELLQLGVS